MVVVGVLEGEVEAGAGPKVAPLRAASPGAALVVFPAGSQLSGGGTAPACRIAYPGTADMTTSTSVGSDLFIRTVGYAAAGCV